MPTPSKKQNPPTKTKNKGGRPKGSSPLSKIESVKYTDLAKFRTYWAGASDRTRRLFVEDLTDEQIVELKYCIELWLRDDQVIDDDLWFIFLICAGRGFGKTHTGAAWLKKTIMSHRPIDGRHDLYAMVAPTYRDLMLTMVPMYLNMFPAHDKPKFNKSTLEIVHSNGAIIYGYSSEKEIRGPNLEKVWCDELGAWSDADKQFELLRYAVRLGLPQILITTTPHKRASIIRSVYDHVKAGDKGYRIRTGSSFDNPKLAPEYRRALEEKRGSRLFRQEALGEILTEAEDAIFRESDIHNNRYPNDQAPDILQAQLNLPLDRVLSKIVVAIDPAGTSNPERDMTGIIVAGVDLAGHAYVLEDASMRSMPEVWARKAVELYHRYHANRIVVEKNFGGDMVSHTLKTIDRDVPIKAVVATRGKMVRAEPISSKYAQNLVHHVGSPKRFEDLENQMIAFTGEPSTSKRKDDRLDALVWALTDIMIDVSWVRRFFNLPNLG